jgi:hypothetical protein
MFNKLLLIVLLLAGFQANASFIMSEGGVYMYNDLEWLDFHVTINKTRAEALAENEGFRLATGAEADSLIIGWFGTKIGPSAAGYHSYDTDANSELFRTTFDSGDISLGNVGAVQVADYGLIGANPYNVYNGFTEGSYGAHVNQGNYGVALVKVTAVSEPAFIALFALGLVGIGFARRRQS